MVAPPTPFSLGKSHQGYETKEAQKDLILQALLPEEVLSGLVS